MAKVYIRACVVPSTDTLALGASANSFITNATVAEPSGGGLTQIDDIDIEFHNSLMFVIVKDLS